jgi:putative oxidoreductase
MSRVTPDCDKLSRQAGLQCWWTGGAPASFHRAICGHRAPASGIEPASAEVRLQGVSMKAPFLIGRMIFGGYFLYSGIHHLQEAKSMGQYAGSKGVPMPELTVKSTGIALIVGGASILTGVAPALGAAVVGGFLAGVSPVMHNFWKVEDPAQRQNEMINFTKNLALLGAALAFMGVETPWPASIPLAQPSKTKRVLKALKREIAA